METYILELIIYFLFFLISFIIWGFAVVIISRFPPWYWDYMHGMTDNNFLKYLFKGRY